TQSNLLFSANGKSVSFTECGKIYCALAKPTRLPEWYCFFVRWLVNLYVQNPKDFSWRLHSP
ncbi:MAG: hypothetical protein ACI9QN_000191, partial [Arcticibacterium sp.]